MKNLIVLLLFTSCSLLPNHKGGENYVLPEKAADIKKLKSVLTATYDESSDSLLFRASFELSGSYVRESNYKQSVRIEKESLITLDSQAMQYGEIETYLGDDTKTDVVGCDYTFQIQSPKDLSHVFVFEWTDQAGQHYKENIILATALKLSSVPASILSTDAEFEVAYGGPLLPSTDKLSVGITACDGSFPDQTFADGTQTLKISTSLFATGDCEVKLTADHEMNQSPEEHPGGGGELVSHYLAAPVSLHIK